MVSQILVGCSIRQKQEFGDVFGCVEHRYIPNPATNKKHKIIDASVPGRGLLNYVLASAQGDIVQVETTFNDYNVLYPDAEQSILTHFNHYLTERFKKGDNVVICCPDSYVRAERLKRLMFEHYGNLTPQIMMELLTDHGNYPSAICRHVDTDKPPVLHFETLVSLIMVPAERTAYIAYGQPCKTKYVKYTF